MTITAIGPGSSTLINTVIFSIMSNFSMYISVLHTHTYAATACRLRDLSLLKGGNPIKIDPAPSRAIFIEFLQNILTRNLDLCINQAALCTGMCVLPWYSCIYAHDYPSDFSDSEMESIVVPKCRGTASASLGLPSTVKEVARPALSRPGFVLLPKNRDLTDTVDYDRHVHTTHHHVCLCTCIHHYCDDCALLADRYSQYIHTYKHACLHLDDA